MRLIKEFIKNSLYSDNLFIITIYQETLNVVPSLLSFN